MWLRATASCSPLLHLQDSCAPLPRLSPPLEWTRKVGAHASAIKTPPVRCAAVPESSAGHLARLQPLLGAQVRARAEFYSRGESFAFYSSPGAVASPRPRLPVQRAEAHCLRRSATVRCPITSRAPRTRRLRALLRGGRNSTRGSGETAASAGRNLCGERRSFSFSSLTDFWQNNAGRTGNRLFSSSGSSYPVLPHPSLLTGTRHAASLPAR